MNRRLVITVCPQEKGSAVLPVERGGRPRRMDAAAVAESLQQLIVRRGLTDHVRVRQACAGGCGFRGPNVTVTFLSPLRPAERPDHVAVAWKTYVGDLESLDCLARVIDENVHE